MDVAPPCTLLHPALRLTACYAGYLFIFGPRRHPLYVFCCRCSLPLLIAAYLLKSRGVPPPAGTGNLLTPPCGCVRLGGPDVIGPVCCCKIKIVVKPVLGSCHATGTGHRLFTY